MRVAAADSGVSEGAQDEAPPFPALPFDDAGAPAQGLVAQTQVPPPLAVAAPAAKSGWPAYVWFALGIGLTVVIQRILKFFTGGGLQRLMLQQMMKNMQNQGAGAGGFPAAGAGFPGGSPFGTAPGAGAGGFPPFGAAAATPTPDPPSFTTTAKPSTPPPPAASATAAAPTEPRTSTAPAGDASAGASTSEAASASVGASDAPKKAPEAPKVEPKKGGFFQDVSETETQNEFVAKPVEETSQSAAADAEVVGDGGATGGGAGANAFGGTSPDAMMDMMESMMKDPNMRDYMLSSLPEGMRNPEMLDMMFKNPMMREQMKSMLANPDAMKEMMQNGMPDMSTMPNMQNMSAEDVKSHFDSLGMTQEQAIQAMYNDPELMSSMAKPKVQQAIMDVSQQPNNITKYADDPDIMKALTKMQQLFTPN